MCHDKISVYWKHYLHNIKFQNLEIVCMFTHIDERAHTVTSSIKIAQMKTAIKILLVA